MYRERETEIHIGAREGAQEAGGERAQGARAARGGGEKGAAA